MPEIELGIGRYQGFVGSLPQEILIWYDEKGDRYWSARSKNDSSESG
jgi:uncharacterized protein (DUF3820 family)